MPLSIDDDILAEENFDQTLHKIYNSSNIKEISLSLVEQEPRIQSAESLLYIGQREFAAVLPNDENIHVLATDDATTCHIVVLIHTGSGAVCLAHCDGSDTRSTLLEMIKKVKELSTGKEGRINLHIAGGFCDKKGESRKVSEEIFNALIKQEEIIHVTSAPILEWNNVERNGVNFPIIYGIAVDARTGETFKAVISERGPGLPIRSASHFLGNEKAINVYDNDQGHLVFGPFTWEPWESVHQWLQMPDSFIRKHLSTSPEQEPDHFVNTMRGALEIIRDHPNPQKSLFPNNIPWRYKKQKDGAWLKIT